MKVWEVGISDAEGSCTVSICATKEIAIRELFKKRDELLKEWEEMKVYEEKAQKEFTEEQNKKGAFFGFEVDGYNMWERMIKNLSHDDYSNWENYPHDTPWIQETEVIDQ